MNGSWFWNALPCRCCVSATTMWRIGGPSPRGAGSRRTVRAQAGWLRRGRELKPRWRDRVLVLSVLPTDRAWGAHAVRIDFGPRGGGVELGEKSARGLLEHLEDRFFWTWCCAQQPSLSHPMLVIAVSKRLPVDRIVLTLSVKGVKCLPSCSMIK